MTSKDFSAKEIEIDLQKYWLVFKRRWPIAAIVCALTTALAAAAFNAQKPSYEAEAKLLFESSNQASSLVGLEGSSRELKALSSQDSPLNTQIEVFRSIPIVQAVIEKLQLKDAEGQLMAPEDFLKLLTVSALPGTDVLRVAFESEDPALAATVVNTITDVYIQNDILVNRSAAVAAQDFIRAQLPQTETEVAQAESALRQFKEANGVVDLTEESRSTVGELSELSNSVTELRSQLADASAQAAEMQQKIGLNSQEAYAVGLVSESPGVQEVLLQLQGVQSELAVASTKYEAVHPAIADIRSREAALSTLLQERIGIALGGRALPLPVDDFQSGQLEQDFVASYLKLEAERKGLEQRLRELTSAQSARQQRAQLLPGLEKQQRELERKLDAAQTTYETLLQNLQQAQVLENQNLGNARVVSPALLPKESLGLPLKLYLLAGGVFGSLLGIMAAFLVDLLDRSVKTVREGQDLYDYPLLGIIPAWKKVRSRTKDGEIPSVLVREPQSVPIVEAYQALQANLKFSCLDKPLKTIAVTSAVAGEGKSEVAANLALTLAHLGHLVLVIDADMRNPTQHHIWEISDLQGLSNFIAGQLPLKNAIVRREPNLHVLPVGVIPPNPLAILESRQISALLRACEKVYDYIIVDTPPLLGLADTLTIGRITDGLLLVMQPEVADADSINAAKTVLVQSQQSVLGVVANGIKVKSRSDRYFYQRQEYVIGQNKESLLGLSNPVETPVGASTRS